MMKTFYTFVLLLLFITLNAQILYKENFETLNSGTIVGQGNYTLHGGTAIVIQDGTNKVLSIGGFANNGLVELGTGDFAGWQTRNSNNDVIQVEYDYYTGPSTSVASMGGIEIIINNEEYVGFLMNMETKALYIAYNYWGIPVQEISLGVKLPANSWIRLGFAYNINTLTVTFKGPGFTKVFETWANPSFKNVGLAYWKLNNEVAEHVFDNVLVKAVEQVSLLAVNEDFNLNSALVVFPNPATTFLNISSRDKILSAYIYDWAGVRQEVSVSDGKIDIKNMPPGSYILGLKTDSGFVSKKFIKK